MKFGILANPVSGSMPLKKKKSLLMKISDELGGAEIVGLDTKSREEFAACAMDFAPKNDVTIIATGDGGLSDIINSVPDSVFAYIPLGTGNIMKYALNLPSNRVDAARKIKNGSNNKLDVISYKNSLAFTVSFGLDALMVQKKAKHIKKIPGVLSYVIAAVQAIPNYSPVNASVEINSEHIHQFENIIVGMITKTPYYGKGLKINPGASLDDGFMLLRVLDSYKSTFSAFAKSLTRTGNNEGRIAWGKEFKVTTNEPVYLQLDGDLLDKQKEFYFKVLPNHITLRY